jgi:hypothetical protein
VKIFAENHDTIESMNVLETTYRKNQIVLTVLATNTLFSPLALYGSRIGMANRTKEMQLFEVKIFRRLGWRANKHLPKKDELQQNRYFDLRLFHLAQTKSYSYRKK